MFPQIYDFRKTVGKKIGNKIENIHSIFTRQQKKKHSTSVCRVLFENILLIFVPRALFAIHLYFNALRSSRKIYRKKSYFTSGNNPSKNEVYRGL